jgi:hypothetical protein
MGFTHYIMPDSGCSAGFSAMVQELLDSGGVRHSGLRGGGGSHGHSNFGEILAIPGGGQPESGILPTRSP